MLRAACSALQIFEDTVEAEVNTAKADAEAAPGKLGKEAIQILKAVIKHAMERCESDPENKQTMDAAVGACPCVLAACAAGGVGAGCWRCQPPPHSHAPCVPTRHRPSTTSR